MKFWTLNKWIALGILGAFATLLLELRFDHRHVLGEHWQAWAPLIYSGIMLVAGSIALARWERGGRVVLFWGFALALAVGSVGFWMHTMGQPVKNVERILAAWSQPINAEHEHNQSSEGAHTEDAHTQSQDKPNESAEGGHSEAALEKPPVLAPLAFCGLGLLGMLACARRFQPEAASRHESQLT